MSFPTKAHIAIERSLDYSDFVPEGFGTADCIVIHGDELHVVDFKYGQGVPVSAEHNPQMQLYALGALTAYGMFYPIRTVHLAIVQPRLNNVSEWQLSVGELSEWGASIKPIARLAYDGKGEYKSGDHCRFARSERPVVKERRITLNLLSTNSQNLRP